MAHETATDPPHEKPKRAKPSPRRRKRRKQKKDEFVSYLVRVAGWDCHYSFHSSDPKSRWETGPYSELATLTFRGALAEPVGTKYTDATVTFSARRGMTEEKAPDERLSIGSIDGDGTELSAYMFVPHDHMASLLTMANSGRVKILHLGGTKLRYRHGMIFEVSLSTKEDDW